MPYNYIEGKAEDRNINYYMTIKGSDQIVIEESLKKSISDDFRLRFHHMLSIPLQGVFYDLEKLEAPDEKININRSSLENLVDLSLYEGKEIMGWRLSQKQASFKTLKKEIKLLYPPFCGKKLLPELLAGIAGAKPDEVMMIEIDEIHAIVSNMIREGGARYLHGA
jgi:hypothetical protein